ncbi:MAG: hypothetical protein R3B48_11615 [Kofleriaceae bacterium]
MHSTITFRSFLGALRVTVSALAVALALVACGEDGATCSSASEAICAAACKCGGSAGCLIGDANGAISFDNKAGCLALYSAACSQAPANVDFAACQDAVGTATCVASPDGMALMLPAACDN